MKPLSNQVVVKMREDLEDKYGGLIPIRINKITGAIEPRPVFGEVLAVGPGDPIQPDIPELKKGDLVIWNLAKVGIPVIEHGQNISPISFNALLARLENPFTETERYIPLLDMVLTEAAPQAMRNAMVSRIVLPDSVMRDGMQERPQGKDVDVNQPVSTVFERVVAACPGIVYAGRNTCARCKCELRQLHKPDVVPGDLVAFNPAWSVDFRRRGRNLRFTPYSELRGVVEE